jgi:hypothetical protein
MVTESGSSATTRRNRCFIGAIISGRHNNRALFHFRQKPAKKPANGGFGVEYALYMMDLSKVYNIGNTGKSALSLGVFERSEP